MLAFISILGWLIVACIIGIVIGAFGILYAQLHFADRCGLYDELVSLWNEIYKMD